MWLCGRDGLAATLSVLAHINIRPTRQPRLRVLPKACSLRCLRPAGDGRQHQYLDADTQYMVVNTRSWSFTIVTTLTRRGRQRDLPMMTVQAWAVVTVLVNAYHAHTSCLVKSSQRLTELTVGRRPDVHALSPPSFCSGWR